MGNQKLQVMLPMYEKSGNNRNLGNFKGVSEEICQEGLEIWKNQSLF